MSELSRYHLNGLRALEAAGRLGSLQRAADELGVTPGAVSQHVLRAERQIGRPVLERTAKGLVPTPFGSGVLKDLAEGFARLERAVRRAASVEDVLTISVAPVFASKWLVSRLARFSARHPDIRVRLDATTDLVNPDLTDIDLAIRVGPGGWPGVSAELLLTQEVFPICAAALASRLTEPADLMTLPVVRDANSVLSWDLWLMRHGLSERDLGPGDTFNEAALCLDAAIAGQGVMLAWQTLAHDALKAGTIVAPFRDRAPSGNGYYLVTSAARKPPPKVARFAAWLREEIAETARMFSDEGWGPTQRSGHFRVTLAR